MTNEFVFFFIVVHRRSLSEDVSMLAIAMHASPSDKARRHALTMCRQDPHYKPRTTNPFAALTQFCGVKKFLGNFSSCELPAPFTLPESTDLPKSLPGSPTAVRKASCTRSPLFVHPFLRAVRVPIY